MATDSSEDGSDAVWALLFPYATGRMAAIRSTGKSFVHYTSAFAAKEIIKHKSVWMRNAAVMIDFLEVEHGHRCLEYAWNQTRVGKNFSAAVDLIYPGMSKALRDDFDARRDERLSETYLISISEHGSELVDEDKYGRLSMWRAYGGTTNVALVMDNLPFLSESHATRAYTSPVLYTSVEDFPEYLSTLAENLTGNVALFRQLLPSDLLGALASALHFAAVSTKHLGFLEEREWRVIY